MDFVKVAHVDDFNSIPHKSFRILARHVAVFKNPDGTFRAIETGCKHAQANLLDGPIKGDIVTCPRHGWKFNLRTGECIEPSGAPLRPYALKIEDGAIYISALPLSPGE